MILEKKTRLQVDLNPQHYARLEALEELVGADSKADVIREALQLYEYIVKRVAAGDRLLIEAKDGKQETMAFFTMPEPR